ncbi:hrg-1 [Pristionchus pacificus]|uniref:Heme transporter hrg-1 n=1 Tax=Pristionchus pacificus TaxID=54126 RepID=A0A8R1Z9M3_PRIPA|nr:hrg-1 [Pristionchus pacificus]
MVCTPKVKMIIAAIGISAGLMAGTWFAIGYHNISTTIMAYASAFFASLSFYMHWAYKKNWMTTWKDSSLKTIFYITVILCIFSTVGMVVCMIVAGINHQGLTHDELMGENLWMTAVWCFMTAKWTGMTAYYARFYSREVMAPLMHSPPIF